MAKKKSGPSQPLFSSPAGYMVPTNDIRGITRGPLAPVTYTEAARYKEDAEAALNVSGSFDLRNSLTGSYVLPAATVDSLGGVKLIHPVDAFLTPRVLAANRGRRWLEFASDPDSTTIRATGTRSAATYGGTSPGAASAVRELGVGTGRKLVTLAASGSAGVSQSATYGTRMIEQPYAYFKFKLDSVADVKFWAYWCNTAEVAGVTNPSTQNVVGVRYDTTVPDGYFMLANSNSGGGTIATQSTGVVPVADTLYELEMWSDGTISYCTINGGSVTSLATQHPTNTVDLQYGPNIWITNQASPAKGITFYHGFHETW